MLLRLSAGPEVVEGFKVADRGGFLESEAFSVVLKIGFVAVCVGAVVALLDAALPVISNTVDAFPTAGVADPTRLNDPNDILPKY